jgi:hypothetical protein
MQFKLDGPAGTIVDYTLHVNQASLQSAMEILDDTALSETTRGKVAGLSDLKIEVNGFVNSTTDALLGPILNGTSITKTFGVYNGVKYYNGEAWPANVQFSGQAPQLQAFSMTLEIDGNVNRTSVGPT